MHALSAAKGGNADAQYLAGYILGQRLHAASDWTEAYKWFLITAEKGYPGARENLAILEERLNVREIDEAKKAAAAFKVER